MWQLVELRSRSWILVTLNREQILAFDLKIAKAVEVAEAVQVFIDVDQAHVLGPSGVRSGIAICIQDGESEKFDEKFIAQWIFLLYRRLQKIEQVKPDHCDRYQNNRNKNCN